MSELVMNPGLESEKVYPLKTGTTNIGRAKENDIVILDASISRQHASIEVSGERVVLNDMVPATEHSSMARVSKIAF